MGYCKQIWVTGSEVPMCSGHGAPMVWQKLAPPREGTWRCLVRWRIAHERHRGSGKFYLTRRRRVLGKQRALIVEQLQEVS